MNLHFKAASVVVVLALVVVFSYRQFFSPYLASAPRDFQTLQVMETEGVSNFRFTNFQGQETDLSNIKGKVVILNFWASWCAPCIEEVPSLINLVKEFKGQVQLIAVSGDSNREDIDVFLKSFPELRRENIHLVWDQDRSLMKRFEVARLPESLVLNKEHKLVKKIVGTIDWHTADSVAYINQLLAK